MTLTLHIPSGGARSSSALSLPDGLTPSRLVEAAARGISNALKGHFRNRNSAAKHREGMPRSNFWSHVADSVQTKASVGASTATAHVLVDHEGVVLHLEGGTVRPKTGKALAIPLVAAVFDQNPREFDPHHEKLSLVWPKGASAGTLRDKKTGEAWFLIVSKADIPADPSVLPSESYLIQAGMEAIQ